MASHPVGHSADTARNRSGTLPPNRSLWPFEQVGYCSPLGSERACSAVQLIKTISQDLAPLTRKYIVLHIKSLAIRIAGLLFGMLVVMFILHPERFGWWQTYSDLLPGAALPSLLGRRSRQRHPISPLFFSAAERNC